MFKAVIEVGRNTWEEVLKQNDREEDFPDTVIETGGHALRLISAREKPARRSWDY
jgi:hypothetical protein